MKMKHVPLNKFYSTLLLFHIIYSNDLPQNWIKYWVESGESIVMEKSNQLLFGAAVLATLGGTQFDMDVKQYSQTNGLLSSPLSRFGDKYGSEWGHWILWSSILTSSLLNNDSRNDIVSKLQFSTLAMVTNGLLTEGLKMSFGRERPNGSCCKSFPSGHTSHSFTIAAIASELYGNNVGTLAYGAATLVAVSRINDNKHYLSDVIFGAALGTIVGRSFAIQYNKFTPKGELAITPQLHVQVTFPL